MSKFFNYYPKTYYTSGANNVTSLDTVTNIIARFGFEKELKENSLLHKNTYSTANQRARDIWWNCFSENAERN